MRRVPNGGNRDSRSGFDWMAVTGVTAWAREVPVAKPHVGVAVGRRVLHVDLARSIGSRAEAVALQAAVCVGPEAR